MRVLNRSMRQPLASLLTVCLLVCSTAHADEPRAPNADEIARRTLRADSFSWEGSKVRLRLTLIDAGGKSIERRMEVLGRRAADGLQTVIRFLSPADISGTAFLTIERKDGAAEQYIYLSGLKRTRRIVGREREGSFMGSDFSYADMQRIDPKHVENVRLADEAVGQDACFVLESRIAEAAGAPYAKIVTWVRKTDFVALRTRFHDRAGKLVKTLYARRVEQRDGRPVVVDARMQSAANGHATELVVESIERRDDLSDAMFTPAALEHL